VLVGSWGLRIEKIWIKLSKSVADDSRVSFIAHVVKIFKPARPARAARRGHLAVKPGKD